MTAKLILCFTLILLSGDLGRALAETAAVNTPTTPAIAQPAAASASTEISLSISEDDLKNIKNPFIDQLPSPVPPPPPPTKTGSKKGQPGGTDSTKTGKGNEKGLPPKEKVEIKAPVFTINGLVWYSDLPQAIVNSKIVGIGDTIDESNVVAISETGIEVIFQGKRFKVLYK